MPIFIAFLTNFNPKSAQMALLGPLGGKIRHLDRATVQVPLLDRCDPPPCPYIKPWAQMCVLVRSTGNFLLGNAFWQPNFGEGGPYPPTLGVSCARLGGQGAPTGSLQGGWATEVESLSVASRQRVYSNRHLELTKELAFLTVVLFI